MIFNNDLFSLLFNNETSYACTLIQKRVVSEIFNNSNEIPSYNVYSCDLLAQMSDQCTGSFLNSYVTSCAYIFFFCFFASDIFLHYFTVDMTFKNKRAIQNLKFWNAVLDDEKPIDNIVSLQWGCSLNEQKKKDYASNESSTRGLFWYQKSKFKIEYQNFFFKRIELVSKYLTILLLLILVLDNIANISKEINKSQYFLHQKKDKLWKGCASLS